MRKIERKMKERHLLDMGSNRNAIRNIVEIKGVRSTGHGMDLHLG